MRISKFANVSELDLFFVRPFPLPFSSHFDREKRTGLMCRRGIVRVGEHEK